MKILFRCDAGTIRGSGHLVRCLTLADELAKQGCGITFACRKDAGVFLDLFKARNFDLVTMPEPDTDLVTTEVIWSEREQKADFQLCQSMVPAQKFDWVIVDHYALGAPWETMARSIGQKIMVIDDLANRPHDCDAMLDQNEYSDKANRYDGLVPANCRMLLGGSYVLLRDEFRLARREIDGARQCVRNIVVLMGGSDYHGQSLRIAKILNCLNSPEKFSVDIILGQQNVQRAEIEALSIANPSLRIHTNHGNISSLMLRADIAFGAGGTATWEFCCLGVPVLMITFAQNQIKMAQDAQSAGFAKYIGHFDSISDDDIAMAFTRLAQDYTSRAAMHSAGCSIVDGGGAQKIADFIASGSRQVFMRKANADDCEDVFEWRNDVMTRAMSIQPDPISFETHKAWFEQSLVRADRLLLVAEINGQKIGIVRFDLTVPHTATISINLNPAWRGRGFGKCLIIEAETGLPREITHILAIIKLENQQSLHAFEGAGYKLNDRQDGLHHYLKHLHR